MYVNSFKHPFAFFILKHWVCLLPDVKLLQMMASGGTFQFRSHHVEEQDN